MRNRILQPIEAYTAPTIAGTAPTGAVSHPSLEGAASFLAEYVMQCRTKRSEADDFDLITSELQKEAEAVFFEMLRYIWDLKDGRDADQLGPRQWDEEVSRYARWLNGPSDRVLRGVGRINSLTALALRSGEQLTSTRG